MIVRAVLCTVCIVVLCGSIMAVLFQPDLTMSSAGLLVLAIAAAYGLLTIFER